MRHSFVVRLSVDETIDIMSESSLPESLVGESYKKEDKNLDGDYCDEGKIGSLADNLSESPPDCDENDDDKKDCIESHSGSEVEDECNKQSKCTAFYHCSIPYCAF